MYYAEMGSCNRNVSNVFCVFVSVTGKGVAVVCVSRVSASAPRDAEEDPQFS